MQTHSLIQGTPDWHAYRANHHNASDAPAMMGESPYKKRSELLHERATGGTKEIDAFTQTLFDGGHRFEALARPLAEVVVGEDLFPVTGSLDRLSASFDGITMGEDVIFEHKTLNDEIRAAQSSADLGLHYRIQMEQQLYVSGADKCLFMATKWSDSDDLIEKREFWYEPDLKLRAAIIAGWQQFAEDLANYEHIEVLPAAVAAPVQDLPALSIRVDGSLTLNHNLVIFGDKLTKFISDVNMKPEDDQAFADAEQAIKVMERAEEALGAAEASALGQISTVDEMVRTVASYKELARKTRLMLEKMVKARKETIRVEIQQDAKDKSTAHIAALNTRLGKPYMPAVAVDFAGVMKNKRTIASLRDAVDTELARFKIEANAIADRIQINLGVLRELAGAHSFLFADTPAIVLKAADDLTALVKLRISEHEAAEAAKAEALRKQIAEEERIKAEKAAAETVRLAKVESDRVAEAAAEAERVRVAADTKRQLDEQAANIAAARAAEKPATVEAPAAVELAQAQANPSGAELSPAAQALNEQEGARRFATHHRSIAPAAVPPSLRLGQINERIAPLSISVEGLRTLGFEPAARDKAAQLYHEHQFPSICAALIRHVGAIQTKQAA